MPVRLVQSSVMYFPDLAPCSLGVHEPEGISVGWLDTAHDFPRGAVRPDLVERLTRICTRPIVKHRGFHVCEFCDFAPDATFAIQKAAGALSSTVIRVVGHDGRIYYSPAMICHYIEAHGYQPPQQFIEAVVEMEYDGDV